MATRPSEFLKQSRGRLSQIAPAIADKHIQLLRDKDFVVCSKLDIPEYVPIRYREIMQRIWMAMLASVIFARATEKISYAERFKLSQKLTMDR